MDLRSLLLGEGRRGRGEAGEESGGEDGAGDEERLGADEHAQEPCRPLAERGVLAGREQARLVPQEVDRRQRERGGEDPRLDEDHLPV